MLHTQIQPEGLAPLPEGIARSAEALKNLPKLPKRQPFALTPDQFADLAPMREADRNVHLGRLAHAHEYEQRRRAHHFGGAGLLPDYLELALAREWPSIRADREAEALRVFEALASRVAA